MNIVKIDSFSIDSLKRRVLKFLRLGKNDVQTSFEIAPFGVDAAPLKDMLAAYSATAEKGKTVFLGVINKNQKADKGEVRLYSLDANASEKIYLWLKNDGYMEVGGNDDHLVRYSKLEEAFNTLQNEFNTHVHPTSAPGSNTAPITIASTANISPAKIERLKTMATD